jgi:hypothetical protein
MKKKQLINEIMGVPKAVDDWVNYTSAVTTWAVGELVKADKWEASEFTNSKTGEKGPMYHAEYEIEGKYVTKLITDIRSETKEEFLDSKTFQDFPLYHPHLHVRVTLFPDNVFEEEGMEDRMGATHSYVGNIQDVKVGKLGKRTIFSRNKFTYDVHLPFSFIEDHKASHDKMLFDMLVPTVGHEMTHAYQTYKQMLGGKTTVGFGRETILNMLPQNMKFQETPSWNWFLHLVYLHLSFEANARVTELYYKMKRSGVKDYETAMKVLSKSEPWNDYRELKAFNAEEFMSKFDAQLHQDDPLQDLFKMFIPKDKRPPDLPKTNEEWYELLINRWDKLIQDAQETLGDMGIEIPVMERVPQKAKDNPLEFFQFFERRFHKKAENLRRKLTRVVSLVLQEAEEKAS